MREQRFIATVENRTKVQEVAEALRKLGFRIDDVLRLGGVIIGALNGKKLDQVKINGVKYVEIERETLGL